MSHSEEQFLHCTSALNVVILQRFMQPKEFNAILRRYEANKIRMGSTYYEPSKKDIACYKDWCADRKTISKVSDDLDVHESTVRSRFAVIGKMVALGQVTL